MIRSTIFLLVALFGVSAIHGYEISEKRVLEDCHKHVAVDKTFAKFYSVSKNAYSDFGFFTNATDRIRFALNIVPYFENTVVHADTFTFEITTNKIVVKNSTTTKTLDTKPILLENQLNEVAVHLYYFGSVRIFINGFNFEVKIGNPNNNIMNPPSKDYIHFNGNKFRLKSAEKPSTIAIDSVSFAVPAHSQSQDFYVSCQYAHHHQTDSYTMDNWKIDDIEASYGQWKTQ